MKVALVLFDWFAHGGLQRDCRRIGESLQAGGAQVTILCMHREGPVPAGMDLVMPALPKGGRVRRRRAFAECVRQLAGQGAYDAVVGFNRLPGLDVYFAADTCFAWKATRERPWYYRLAPRSRQYLAFEKAVFGEAARTTLLMLSPLQKREYLACYPRSAPRMIDIPPGIARDRMAADDAPALRRSLRREFAVADDQLLVLQVGSGFPVKGVDRSLAALAALPGSLRECTRLLVIGRDDPAPYRQKAADKGLGSCVTFLESRDDLPRFYQGADLLLHPSRKESAGMVILEAIVAGLPVLTTGACGYAFHVEAANAGVVLDEPFSQQALNTALAAMLAGGERPAWRDNGIRYGQTADLYAMPERVAELVLNASGTTGHDG